MKSPHQSHLQAAKKILQYVKSTLDVGILYSPIDNFGLVGYIDSDWTGDYEKMKSTLGYAFHMGSRLFS